ncbi:MAG: ribosomal protein S18-alanine N-acetyltransferase [Candidatus Thorarchaeota archaeon]
MAWQIRPAQERDVAKIKAIENGSFPRPWDESLFRIIGAWRGRVPIERNRVIFMYVAETDEELLGYVVWEEDVTERIGHILNVAVKTERRREGLGTALINHAFDTLRSHRINSCRLEVRPSNTAARRLYERAGMAAQHEESGYYGDEDAIVYSIKL